MEIIWAATDVTVTRSGGVYRDRERRLAVENGREVYRNGYSDPAVFNNRAEAERFADMLSDAK